MKKLLLVLGIFVLLVVAAAIVVSLTLDNLVRNGVNRFGPQLTGTPVVLEEAQLSPLSGAGTLRGLTVGNPEGWSGDKAFSVAEVKVGLQTRTLWGEDTIVIDELVVQRPEFVYEQRLTGGSNLRDLMENVRKAIGPAAERPIGAPEEPPRKFIIHRLRLQDGVVHAGLGPAAFDVPLPELSYDDLGVAEGGLTGAQIASVVLSDVVSRVISTVTERGVIPGRAGEALEAIGGALKDSGGSLQRLLGGRKDPPAEPPKEK